MAIIISTTDENEARELNEILIGFGQPYRIYVRGREFWPDREPELIQVREPAQ